MMLSGVTTIDTLMDGGASDIQSKFSANSGILRYGNQQVPKISQTCP